MFSKKTTAFLLVFSLLGVEEIQTRGGGGGHGGGGHGGGGHGGGGHGGGGHGGGGRGGRGGYGGGWGGAAFGLTAGILIASSIPRTQVTGNYDKDIAGLQDEIDQLRDSNDQLRERLQDEHAYDDDND